jgi:hypothetical protein
MAQSSTTHVATPFGKHPPQRVRRLGDDESVTHQQGDGDQIVHQDAEGTKTTLTASPETADTTGAAVTTVTAESTDTAAASTDPSEVPELIAWATWTNDVTTGANANHRFSGRLTVPEAPTAQEDKQLFVTLALQSNDNPVMILTTSLQWGRTGAGGGDYWAVACWAAIGAQVFFSKLVRVEPGDVIECAIYQEERAGSQTWNSEAKLGSQGTSTGLNSDRGLNIAIPCMFEAAESATCGDYPNGRTDFENLKVEGKSGALDPTWTPQIFVDTCGTEVQVEDQTTIRLTYK